MVRTLLAALAATAMITAPAVAGDCGGCAKAAKTGNGFCCGKGKVFGVELASKKLYQALAGHEVDGDMLHCPGCVKAFKSSGTCTHCKFAVAGGKAYRSPVAHVLAKGKVIDAEKRAGCGCGTCKAAFKKNGSCDSCKMGFVAGRMFGTGGDYKAALAAYETLKKAVVTAKHCEDCAVGLVTDGACAACKVSFKDGKLVSKKG